MGRRTKTSVSLRLGVMGAASLAWVVTFATTRAQDAPAAAQRENAAKPLLEFKEAAAGYRLASEGEKQAPLVLIEKPVLSWNNPLRQTVAGAVFVWVLNGRPEVVASLYRYTAAGEAKEDHEFQSLATTGVTARDKSGLVWSPAVAGVQFHPIPGAPAPAAAAPDRLRQMRALAREFHAFIDFEKPSELRLLTQPLYRYETQRADLTDGALFAFVQATDPEVLLLIEARPFEGKPTWQYGLARMSMVNLKARHKDRDVWRVPWVVSLTDPQLPYITIPRAPGSEPGR